MELFNKKVDIFKTHGSSSLRYCRKLTLMLWLNMSPLCHVLHLCHLSNFYKVKGMTRI